MSHDVKALRAFMADEQRWSDDEMAEAIVQAKEWIGGRRWSWKVVASNILRDGVPSPRVRS